MPQPPQDLDDRPDREPHPPLADESQEQPLTPAQRQRLFARGSWGETRRVREVLADETVGGILLVVAALLALIWANSPLGDAYFDLRDTKLGPEALHLDLTIGHWAADGLLAIFFFVAGLELKKEFVAGDLRDPRRAALPIVAAVGGMIVPALLFVAINAASGTDGALAGWAIPVATDIAFALAVLAVISSHLPTALRTFLLTLAIVDDLLAIIIIAVFFTAELDLLMLALAVVPIAVFGVLAQKRVQSWAIMLPLALVAWGLVHASGIHATVAGVLLAFTMPVLRSEAAGGPDAGPGYAEHCEHKLRPISAGFAVPVFAFFSAGVAVGGFSGLTDALGESITLGIIAGLVVGKTLGVLGATWLMAKFTKADLDDALEWIDVLGLAMLAGIGFTVSLLIGELAYDGEEAREFAKVGVLVGSLLAATLASLLLRSRNAHYRRIAEAEAVDADADGIPDVYQRG